VKASATTALHLLATERRRSGLPVLDLSVGQPILDSSGLGFEAILSESQNYLYSAVPGLATLRESLQSKFQCTSLPLITAGAKASIYLALRSLLEPGDEVLYMTPYWSGYPGMVEACYGKSVQLSSSDQHEPEPDKWQEQISKKAKVLLLNSANNPTGKVYSRDQIKRVVEFCERNGLTLISDEVYLDLSYEKEAWSALEFLDDYSDIVVANSVSKSLALPGLRTGWAISNSNLIEEMSGLQSQLYTCAPTLCQRMVESLLENGWGDRQQEVRNKLRLRRDLVMEKFKSAGFKELELPESALYFYLSAATQDSSLWGTKLLEKTGVVTVPSRSFGEEGKVRISFGLEESELALAIDKLIEFTLSEKV